MCSFFFFIFNCSVFSALHAKHFWDKKKYFMKLMSRLLHSTIHQVMFSFWVFTVNPFSLSWSFFFSRKLLFLWSPCLLLIQESISLDTSGKPTLGFFSKITSPSWIMLSISLNELNSINWLFKSWWRVFLKFYFIVVKEFWYGKKYLRFFGEFIWILFFEYYCEC